MENDEITLDIQEEQQENEIDLVEQTESDDISLELNEDEDELAKAKAEAAKYRRLFEKTQQKPKPQAQVAQKQVSPQPNIEEVVLQANGMSDELLNELKAVAKARNITSLIKAQTDPLFVAMKEKIEQDKKQKAIGMQASRGSGSVKAQKTFNTPGLSREEHKKLIENLK